MSTALNEILQSDSQEHTARTQHILGVINTNMLIMNVNNLVDDVNLESTRFISNLRDKINFISTKTHNTDKKYDKGESNCQNSTQTDFFNLPALGDSKVLPSLERTIYNYAPSSERFRLLKEEKISNPYNSRLKQFIIQTNRSGNMKNLHQQRFKSHLTNRMITQNISSDRKATSQLIRNPNQRQTQERPNYQSLIQAQKQIKQERQIMNDQLSRDSKSASQPRNQSRNGNYSSRFVTGVNFYRKDIQRDDFIKQVNTRKLLKKQGTLNNNKGFTMQVTPHKYKFNIISPLTNSYQSREFSNERPISELQTTLQNQKFSTKLMVNGIDRFSIDGSKTSKSMSKKNIDQTNYNETINRRQNIIQSLKSNMDVITQELKKGDHLKKFFWTPDFQVCGFATKSEINSTIKNWSKNQQTKAENRGDNSEY